MHTKRQYLEDTRKHIKVAILKTQVAIKVQR